MTPAPVATPASEPVPVVKNETPQVEPKIESPQVPTTQDYRDMLAKHGLRVGDYVTCEYRMPTKLQYWASMVQVGRIEDAGDDPAAWNGGNSEAQYCVNLGKVRVLYVRDTHAFTLWDSVSALRLAPTGRYEAFAVDSADEIDRLCGQVNRDAAADEPPAESIEPKTETPQVAESVHQVAIAETPMVEPKTETPQVAENEEAARKHAMMTATYSPEDNKLRLYSSGRLDPETYARVKAAGFSWAPKQGLFVAPRWTPEREDLLIELAGEVGDEDTSLVARAEDRADRFSDYSSSRANDARMAKNAVDRIADGIPMGQPILVGHHSERHARRDAERIENGMRKAVKMWETAEYWKYRAAGAIQAAKYKERPDVRHRRIKGLEADLRSCIADYTPQQPVHRIMQTGYNDTEPSIHVWVGPKGRGGRWVKEASLPAIKASRARWEQHYQNRIEYEKAMLAESGGIAADSFDIKPGGRILYGAEWLPVLRINKANGEIRSVTVAAPGNFTWRNTLTVEIESVRQYRDPEPGDEEKARQSVKKAPLCNYPGEDFRHLTKAEWDKIYTDYKSTRTIDATHRVRYAIFGGKRLNVYLTDSKRIDPPAEAKPIEPVTFEPDWQLPEPPKTKTAQAEPEAAEFAEMRESLRQGVQVVTAPQLFPTPPEVAARMVELADIRPDSAVLEPSAGTGRLLDALLNADGGGWKTAPVSRLVAVERNCKLADSLRRTYAAGDVHNADFLECTADDLGQFDAVIMNPPLENGSDIKHIQHAAGMLKPGGKLVAICANGPRQNEKLKPLADQWEELPAGTFAGTNVRTVLLTISKPNPMETAAEPVAAEPAPVAPVAVEPAAVDETQERIARLLAELKASRLPAPAGKLAVRYPDGRIGYIPDPAAAGGITAAPSCQVKTDLPQGIENGEGARNAPARIALAPSTHVDRAKCTGCGVFAASRVGFSRNGAVTLSWRLCDGCWERVAGGPDDYWMRKDHGALHWHRNAPDRPSGAVVAATARPYLKPKIENQQAASSAGGVILSARSSLQSRPPLPRSCHLPSRGGR